jgi:peptidoglycan/LPS O-acetylase OafA/YrhL
MIYYTIYPLILKIRRNSFSWQQITVVSFLIGMMITATNPTAGNYPSFGIGLTWLLGLPCWLLGVQLAELVVEDQKPKPKNIWAWRTAILIASSICSVLRFHSPLGYPWTLNFFAIFVFFWLLQEIRFYRYETPPSILEWMGKWSYSIYLIHLLGQSIWMVTLRDINLGYCINWMVKIAFILLCSYLFALAVEFPTHKLARSIAYHMKAKNNFC